MPASFRESLVLFFLIERRELEKLSFSSSIADWWWCRRVFNDLMIQLKCRDKRHKRQKVHTQADRTQYIRYQGFSIFPFSFFLSQLEKLVQIYIKHEAVGARSPAVCVQSLVVYYRVIHPSSSFSSSFGLGVKVPVSLSTA